MTSGKTHDKGQKLVDRGNKSLSQAAVTLLKTQDAGYLRTMLQQTKKERERLEKEVVLGAQHLQTAAFSQKTDAFGSVSTKKIIYLDSPESPLPSTIGKGTSEDDFKNFDQESLRELRAVGSKRRKARTARMSKLIALKEREAALAEAGQELDLQRAKMSNNIGGVNKNGTKWKAKGRKK